MTLLKKLILIFVGLALLSACSRSEDSIYRGIPSEGDGVIAVDIPEDDGELIEEPSRQGLDELSETEQQIVDDYHESEYDKLSFLVVDVENDSVMRSYLASTPRRLASISKIATSLGALERVRNVEVPKVSRMLKNSHNGEASRYVRLAAKAIDGTVTPGSPYVAAASCPTEFLNDEAAAHVVFKWLMEELSVIDWTDASFNDGAGCHYENFMSANQIASLIQYADLKGSKYNGMSYEKLLSVSGTDGTWKNHNKDHKGRIFAKTGTLNPNSNLAGFFYARRGGVLKKYYFVVFVEKKGGGSYTTKARNMIESLVRYWINYYSVNQGDAILAF